MTLQKKLLLAAIFFGVIIIILLIVALFGFRFAQKQTGTSTNPESLALDSIGYAQPSTTSEPEFTVEKVVENLTNAWDVGFLPDETMVFTQRGAGFFVKQAGQGAQFVAKPSDLYVSGEGGMLSLAVSRDFVGTREIFICFNSIKAGNPDVRIVRFKLSDDLKQLTERADIITGMPSNASGRHSGCRLELDNDNNLWVGTGDAAIASNPQDPKSLGGKILRVDRNGTGVAGNLTAPFDPRIYSYGHRNTQGIALLGQVMNGSYGFSVEHGSNRDDEINKLATGNFGWDPDLLYLETVPMIDKTKFPTAVDASWSSGDPTIATAGATFVRGKQWASWEGSLLVGVLKNAHIRRFAVDLNGNLTDKGQVLTDYGRIRSLTQADDGSIYFTTDNGFGKDIIGRIVPN